MESKVIFFSVLQFTSKITNSLIVNFVEQHLQKTLECNTPCYPLQTSQSPVHRKLWTRETNRIQEWGKNTWSSPTIVADTHSGQWGATLPTRVAHQGDTTAWGTKICLPKTALGGQEETPKLWMRRLLNSSDRLVARSSPAAGLLPLQLQSSLLEKAPLSA